MAHSSSEGNCSVKGEGVWTSLNTGGAVTMEGTERGEGQGHWKERREGRSSDNGRNRGRGGPVTLEGGEEQ